MSENVLNIYAKLQNAREEINQKNIPKSGWSDFGDYAYHELSDFMPFVVKACKNNRITPIFEFNEGVDGEGKKTEIAKLTLYDWDSEKNIRTNSPVEGFGNKKMKPIQELGSRHTFMRRYLYMNMFEISDRSIVEIVQEQEQIKEDIENSKKKIEDNIKKKENGSPDNKPQVISAQQLIAMGKAKGFTEDDLIAKYKKEHKKEVKSVEKIPKEVRVDYYNRIKKG